MLARKNTPMKNTRLDNVVAFAGRKNLESSSLVGQLTDELHARGIFVSSVVQRDHDELDIVAHGKSSNQRSAPAAASVISSMTGYAMLERIEQQEEPEVDLTDVEALLRKPEQNANARERCIHAIGMLPASNLVLMDGFGDVGLPTIELFSEACARDKEAASRFIERLNAHVLNGPSRDVPGTLPAAIVTDMPEITSAVLTAGLPCFGLYDIAQIATWLIDTFAKPLLSVVIPCDGESRRMAGTRALLPFHGRPVIEHMLARFAPLAADMVVVSSEPEKLSYLEIRYPGLRIVTNRFKKRGPIPDFVTALEEARCPAVTVVACDMADASPELIEHEADMLEASQRAELFLPFDAVVPMNAQGFEAFCGTYQRKRCLEAARACLDRGKIHMKHLLETLNVRIIDMNDASLCPTGCFTRIEAPTEKN